MTSARTISADSDLEATAPDITQLVEALHSRPFPELTSPVAVSRIALLNQDIDLREEASYIGELAAHYDTPVILDDANFFYHKFRDFVFSWERHTEYSSYTIVAPRQWDKPFSHSAAGLVWQEWLQQLGGQRIAAFDVEIVTDPAYLVDSPELRNLFNNHRLFGTEVIERRAVLWTTARLHDSGCGRVLICDHDLSGHEVGRLVRAVLELDTYRNLALIALPLVLSMLPEVKRQEERLAGIIERIPGIETVEQEQETLDGLSRIAALVERSISNITYRYSATQAYSDIVSRRLQDLDATPIRGVTSVATFMSWKFQPAIQTVESVANRLLTLSRRITRATDLLRTRVDLSIQVQNQSLLKSMDERSKLSLYIQRSVEGLSVIIISYYVIMLLEKLLKMTKKLPFVIDIDMILAGLVPVTLVSVWFAVRGIKKRVDRLSDEIEK